MLTPEKSLRPYILLVEIKKLKYLTKSERAHDYYYKKKSLQ